MNDAHEPPKLAPLESRPGRVGEQRVGEWLEILRGIAGKRLRRCLDHLFDHVDDALFDLAEKAENNATQMHYFDGMREVRKRRPAIERSFHATVERGLVALVGRSAPATGRPAGTPSVELSPVVDTELEEALAITSMSSKHENRLARDLFAVNQRLSVLCGDGQVDDARNPIAPASLSRAFRLALKELGADMRVKLLIYKLFDRYVLAALEALYAEANAELARAGVLPELRPTIVHGIGATHSVAASGYTTDEAVDPATNELLQTLHRLLTARRGDSTHSTLHRIDMSGPPPSPNELLGALSVLQTRLASGGFAAPAPANGTDAFDHEAVLQLKKSLLGQLSTQHGARSGHISSVDEETIELVGMLFEFILDDPTLPPEMQALLARLQIPYLKAAILDRKLFAHRQHPARRLLDGLAEQAKSWSPESDRDRRLQDMIKGIVDQLLHDFSNDLGIFERLLLDLQQFVETNRHRSDLAEQRVAEFTRGREKLELARRRAAHEIVERIGDHSLPPLAYEVLVRAWANHLVLVLLRHGEQSNEFRNALRFVDDFIASTHPAPDAAARRRLRQSLPSIEQALRQGLTNLAFQPQDIERLLAQLQDWYAQQLGSTTRVTTPADALQPVASAIPENLQPIVAQQAEPDERSEETVPAADSSAWPHVQALQIGAWLEFQLPGEPMVRAKLSWISPVSGRYLFVNRHGLKIADYSPQELVMLLANGHAQLLAAKALFDRAMNAIVNRLSQPETSGSNDT